MEVFEFDISDTVTWDAFVEQSFNGTLMHQRRFLNYHPSNRFQDRSILIRDNKGRLIAVFPAAEVEDHGRRVLKSHPGASYGGLVVRNDYVSDVDSIVSRLVEHACTRRFDAIWLRAPERIFYRYPFDDLDSAMFRAGFRLVGRELSTAFCLQSMDEQSILKRFHSNARRNVLKAIKTGVKARVSEDISEYWDILRDNLESQHSVHPTHSREEMEMLRSIMGDRVQLVGGYWNNQLVAGVFLFVMNQYAAHTMYIAQDYRYNHCHALPLVIYQSLVECQARGLQYLNYGISTQPGSLGMQLNTGLHMFKQRMGGESVFRDIWQLDL